METLFGALEEAAERFGDKPFLCAPPRTDRQYLPGGAEYSFAEVLTGANALADAYAAAGWGPGHRVALAMDNHPGHFLHFLALNRIGATQVPVNPYYLPEELRYLYAHSEAELTIAAPWMAPQLEGIAGPMVVWEEGADFAPPAPKSAAKNATPGRETAIAIVYTSGTTARPKGCVLSNEYALTVGAWYRDLGGALHLEPGQERVYVPLPTFHVNGGINTPAAMLLSGNCMIQPDRFHAATWWDDLASTRATAMHYLGIIPPVLMAAPPRAGERNHGIKFGLGAGLDPSLHAAFEERFGIAMVEVWGMTETGRFLADNHAPRAITTRAFGRPSGDLEAIVLDAKGHEVPRGAEGELCVRATGADPRRGFFTEYFKNPEATQEAWKGGWFHTGDVVVQDETDMLFFVERAKNIIRRSGENISAAEVENALIEHADVAQVAVLSCPDDLRDEEVFACVKLVEGASRDVEGLMGFAQERLAYYKLPGWVAFFDSLPVTGTQKIQKHQIFKKGEDPRGYAEAVDVRALKSSYRKM